MDIKKQAIKKHAVSLAEKFKKFCARKKNSDQKLLNRYRKLSEELRAIEESESGSVDAIILVTLDREKNSVEKRLKKRGLTVPHQ